MFGRAYRSLLPIQSKSFNVRFSTNLFLKSYSRIKESKVMNKFLQGSKGKKKKFYEYPSIPSLDRKYFDLVPNLKTSYKADKRQTVLNKVFMKNITDLMATGELCPKIVGRGIQISKVKITPTFHQINVYWLANETDEDVETAKILCEFAPKLRHELSQMRLMGCVPKIEFIKDASYLKYMVVENILKTVDYGDDFEPTPLANDWKSNDIPKPPDASVLKDSANEEQECTSKVFELPLPVMRMDTLGLDYEAITKRINQSVQRAKAAHRRDSSLKLPSDESNKGSCEAAHTLNTKERKKLLKDFFKKKKLEMKKSAQTNKKYCPESVIHEQELESRLLDEYIQYSNEEYSEEFDRNSSYLEDDYSRN